MKNHITVEELKRMILYVASHMVANEKKLTAIDSTIGDGDHGHGIAHGFGEVSSELPKMEFASAEEVLLATGNLLLDTMGGASGVLFGTLFISGTVKRQPSLTMDLQDFAEIFRHSLDSIMQRGKAHVGDKTMVDSLEPAVRALEEGVREKKSFCEGFRMAAASAKKGAEYTKELRARFGRAKYFGEKAIGHMDAGAVSVSLIFEAMYDWIEENFARWEKYESKVVTITMNPCIDKTLNITNFSRGSTHRLQHVQNDISGKGINVSIALTHFGDQTICLGFNYMADARLVEKALDEQNVLHDFVMVEGTVRTNVKIFEDEYGVMTEFNEKGGCVGNEAIEELLARIESYMEQANIIVLAGSIPDGVSRTIYRTIIEIAREHDVRTILDANGDLLQYGIEAKPYLIKPNLSEFCETYKIEESDENGILKKASEIVQMGVKYVCISLGKAGAYLVGNGKMLRAEPLDVPIRGVQGAGDSMVAGLCHGINCGCSVEKMFAYGVAAASGSLQYTGTKICTLEDLEELFPKVKVCEICSHA